MVKPVSHCLLCILNVLFHNEQLPTRQRDVLTMTANVTQCDLFHDKEPTSIYHDIITMTITKAPPPLQNYSPYSVYVLYASQRGFGDRITPCVVTSSEILQVHNADVR